MNEKIITETEGRTATYTDRVSDCYESLGNQK